MPKGYPFYCTQFLHKASLLMELIKSKILRRNTMTFNEIQNRAKGMGINIFRMKKTDMIRSIQSAENKNDCYGTERVENCYQDKCLWRDDCRSLNNKK